MKGELKDIRDSTRRTVGPYKKQLNQNVNNIKGKIEDYINVDTDKLNKAEKEVG